MHVLVHVYVCLCMCACVCISAPADACTWVLGAEIRGTPFLGTRSWETRASQSLVLGATGLPWAPGAGREGDLHEVWDPHRSPTVPPTPLGLVLLPRPLPAWEL